MYCATHKYIETNITCDTCSKAICGKCLKTKEEKVLCTLCYIKTITKKTSNFTKEQNRRKGATRKNPYSTKSFDINPDRLQSMVQIAQLKQEQAKKERNRVQKKLPVNKPEEKVYCNWHKRIIAEYYCEKCDQPFCRECLGNKRFKDRPYCTNCWNKIRFADILARKKK